MPLLFSYSVRAVANSEPGPERGTQTKGAEGALFGFRVGGKGSVVSRRGVNDIALRPRAKAITPERRAEPRAAGVGAGSARSRRSYGLGRERAEA